MSDSLQPHGLQHARLPCPSPTPEVYSNSCPLSHLTISSSSSPSPPAFNFSQHQGLFKWVSSLHQVAKVLEFQLQHLSFIVTIFFTNWRFVTTLCQTSLLAPFFPNSICSLCVSVSCFGNSHNTSNFFIIIFVKVIWEKAMAPHSSTFAWKMPWTEEPDRLQCMGSLESDMTERLHFHFSLSCVGEGNGKRLQCSCLENPRDGEAWWAAVSGVAQSRTWLKQLSSSSKVISSQGSLILLLQKDYDLLKAHMMVSIYFFNKNSIFKLRHVHCFC